MFYCQITGKLSKPGAKPERLVVKTREKTYTKWVRNEETNKWEEVFLAKGWEIVKELNASQEGAQLWNDWLPEEREAFLKHSVR
jgi:hypothetical protein